MTSPAPRPPALDTLRTVGGSGFALSAGQILAGESFTSTEAVLVRDGQIAVLGTAADVVRHARALSLPVIELPGVTVAPGFHDTHFHMMATGANALAIDLSGASSVADVIELISDAASHTDEEWLFAAQLDEAKLSERRVPSLDELDALGDRPIYISDRGLHYTVVNSAAAARLGIGDAGNGRLQEGASGRARDALGGLLSEQYRQSALREASARALSRGITTVHALEGGELFDDRDASFLADYADQLDVRTVLYWCTDDIEAIAARGLRRGGGDVCVDGSLGSSTAALHHAYADGPTNTGLLLRDRNQLADLFARAEDAGVQFGVHAIGDAAVDEVIAACRAVFPRGTQLMHRIEHFGMPSRDAVAAAADLGLAIAAQPSFAYLRGQHGGVYHSRLGDARLRRAYPLRSLLQAGLLVAGGSDSDVTPADPLLGVQAAVNHPCDDESIDVEQALHLFTSNGARIAGNDPRNGLLVEGGPADLVVLDSDPLTRDSHELAEICVLATVVAGIPRYLA